MKKNDLESTFQEALERLKKETMHALAGKRCYFSSGVEHVLTEAACASLMQCECAASRHAVSRDFVAVAEACGALMSSGVDGHEDEVNGILRRIETMIQARTAMGCTKDDLERLEQQLNEREASLVARESDVLDRERDVASREAAVSQRERLRDITPPPPPVHARRGRGICVYCRNQTCTKDEPCYDAYGNDNHTHNCYSCYRHWKHGSKGAKCHKGSW